MRTIRPASASSNRCIARPRPERARAFALWLASLLAGAACAEPALPADACYVRAEPPAAAASSSVVPAAAESRLGIRRRTGQLFDVELSVVGAGGALCSVSGIARLRPGDVLVLPVRPEAGKSARPQSTPCLVSLRHLGTAVEVSTTEAACQAQSLCAGQVQLHGQRFELATRLPPGGRSACFAAAPT